MAKKTTPRAKPRTEPAPAAPELDSPATGSTRRRASKAPGTRAAKAAKAAHAEDAEAAATGSAAVRRPRRKASQLPTQANEQTQSPAPVPPVEAVSDEEVRMRAYFLSLERGPHGGSDTDYWLQAERELRSKTRK